MIYKKILIVALISLISLSGYSQDITRHSMHNLPSAGITNASYFPEFRYTVGIMPFPQFNYSFETNIRVRNLYSIENETLGLHVNQFLNKMPNVGFIRTGIDYEILSGSFKIKRNYFSLAFTTHVSSELRLPRDLFALAWQGNGAFIGKRISFDGLGMDATAYNEFAIGYSRDITERLNAGVRLSLLQGLVHFSTQTQIGLTTDTQTYWLHADYDIKVNISGPVDTSMFSENSNADPLEEFLSNPARSFGLSNFGLGFDIGADYDLTDNFNIALSLNDLGYIKWKNDVKTYAVENGKFSFEGIKIDSTLNIGFDSSYFSELKDSVFSFFKPVRTTESFNSNLTPKIYLTLSYDLNEKNRFGFVFYNHLHSDYNMSSFSLLYNRKLWKFINLAGNYTFNTYGQSRLWAGMSLRIMGSNFYIMTNDVSSFIQPTKANINFNFGWYYIKGKPAKSKNKVKKKKSEFQF